MYGTRLKADRRTGTASSGAARTPAIETLRYPLASLPGASGSCAFQRRVQAKLAVSDPNDIYEQEADRVADQVMRMPGPAVSGNRAIASNALPDIQRRCAACTEEQAEDKIHRKQHTAEAPDLTPETERHIGSLNGGGQPLPDATRAFFEPRFGVDFSAVRIHTDTKAAESARSIGALAYTVGRDVVFNTGQYAPQRDSGKRLLAHELTHVVQQSSGGNRLDHDSSENRVRFSISQPATSVHGRGIQREPVTAGAATVTIGAVVAKCIIGAITGALFDAAIQAALHAWRQRTWRFWRATLNYCSIILSAILGCIAAPVSAFILEAWIVARLGALGGIAGTLIGKILIFIAKKLAIGVPKALVGKLAKLGCISPEQAAELGVTPDSEAAA